MTLNASGPISLGGSVIGQSIQYEIFQTTAPTLITLNDPKVRQLAQKLSGAIAMPQDFYGKTYTQFFTISTSQVNFNLLTYLNANGWDPLARADVTIAPGVYIYSNSTGTPAMTISGVYSKGVKITNNGFIVGMGGQGGNGTGGGGLVGLPGGLALSVSSAVTINNTSGTIGGGGGGGGGGAGYTFTCPCSGTTTTYVGGGGGGGRTGLVNSLGGTGFGAGNQGTSLSGGTGGGGQPPPTTSGGGGNGGTWGSTGGSGGSSAASGLSGGSGGAAGAAITGNTNITWEGFGTRLGAIS